MNTATITQQAVEVILSTGSYIKEQRSAWSEQNVSQKADRSLVTSVDIGAEQRLVDGFSKILPSSTFIAEENHRQELAEYTWIIDPIDGTTNFVHNLPMYCISVGLLRNGKPIMGCIYEIQSGELYLAHEDMEGATLNDKPIHVSNAHLLADSLLATGFPSTDFERLDYYMIVLKELMQKSQGLRRLGSAAMDLAYVACGRCDGFYEYGLSPWDVAGGAYIVQKAGGMVTTFSGTDDFIFGKEIVASNGLFHNELQQVFINNTK